MSKYIPPENRPEAQHPHISFDRGVKPRTEFFVLEDLPTRTISSKSRNDYGDAKSKFRQAKINKIRWNKNLDLLTSSEIIFGKADS